MQVEAKLKYAAWRASELSRTLALNQAQAPAAVQPPAQQPPPPQPPPPPSLRTHTAADAGPAPGAPQLPGGAGPNSPYAAPSSVQQPPPAAPDPAPHAGFPPSADGMQWNAGGASDAAPQAAAPGAPWRPAWGVGVASLAAGDRVLYRTQGDSFVIASIVQVRYLPSSS